MSDAAKVDEIEKEDADIETPANETNDPDQGGGDNAQAPEEISDADKNATTGENFSQAVFDNKPEVSEHFVQELENERAENGDKMFDSEENEFIPGFHMERDGEPVLTKKGLFRKKPGVKPGGPKSDPISATKTQSEKPANHKLNGEMLSGIFLNLTTGFGGEEWVPSKDEKKMLDDSFTNYCAAKDMKDLPPGFALVAAISIYSVPRFQKPQTKKKVTNIFKWLKTKFKKKKGNNHAHISNGSNDDREIDSNKVASQGFSKSWNENTGS